MILSTRVHFCVKHTSRPNADGASSQDDQHVADASTRDVNQAIDEFLNSCAHNAAHSTTYRL
eukprot:5762775-Prorocentrum_lima.AAC.1